MRITRLGALGLALGLLVGPLAQASVAGDDRTAPHPRYSRSGPVLGGSLIAVQSTSKTRWDAALCTTAAVWRDAKGRPGFLTAGHCMVARPGGGPWWVKGADRSTEYYNTGDTFGTSQRDDAHFGDGRGDVAFVPFGSGQSGIAGVFTREGSSRTYRVVRGSAAPVKGLRVCTSGAKSAPQACGWTVTHSEKRYVSGARSVTTPTSRPLGRMYNAQISAGGYGTCPLQEGDSGGPVMTQDATGVRIVGVISSGDSKPIRNVCTVQFTSIADVQSHLGGGPAIGR